VAARSDRPAWTISRPWDSHNGATAAPWPRTSSDLVLAGGDLAARDWRTVQLPPQRKTKTAILGELNCGPSGRPQPEQYRPAPQLGPTREQQKEKLIMKMA
jgi:hypothetical protein